MSNRNVDKIKKQLNFYAKIFILEPKTTDIFKYEQGYIVRFTFILPTNNRPFRNKKEKIYFHNYIYFEDPTDVRDIYFSFHEKKYHETQKLYVPSVKSKNQIKFLRHITTNHIKKFKSKKKAQHLIFFSYHFRYVQPLLDISWIDGIIGDFKVKSMVI